MNLKEGMTFTWEGEVNHYFPDIHMTISGKVKGLYPGDLLEIHFCELCDKMMINKTKPDFNLRCPKINCGFPVTKTL